MIIKGGLLVLARLLVIFIISRETNSDDVFVVMSYLTVCSVFRLGSVSRLIELFNGQTEPKQQLEKYTFLDFQFDGLTKLAVWLIFFPVETFMAYNLIFFRGIGEYSKVYFVINKNQKLYGFFDIFIELTILITFLLDFQQLWWFTGVFLVVTCIMNIQSFITYQKFKLNDLSYFQIEIISSLIYSVDNIILSQLGLVNGFITNYNIIFRILSVPQRILDFTTHLTKSVNEALDRARRTNLVQLWICIGLLVLATGGIVVLEQFSMWQYFEGIVTFEQVKGFYLLIGFIFAFIITQLWNRYEKNKMIRLARLSRINKYNTLLLMAFLVFVSVSIYLRSWELFLMAKILISVGTLIIVRFENKRAS